MTRNTPRQNREDLLLIIRGIAALSVVFWHAGGYAGLYPSWITIPGRTAVWLFFGISGYVIAYGFVHGRYSHSLSDLRDFYINRFLRIYPIFLVLTFLGWITEMLSNSISPIAIGDIPAQLFAVQFDQSYILNGVFWTLGIELHFYLLAPLLVMPLLQSHRAWSFWTPIAAYFMLLLGLVLARRYLGWTFDGRNIIACLPHFIIGMFGCKLTMKLPKSQARFWYSLSISLGLIIVTNMLYHHAPRYFWSPIGIVLVDASMLSLIVAHSCWSGSKSIPVMIMTLLGTLSYGLYAWHGYWMRTMPALEAQPILLVVLSLVSAYSTYWGIEKAAHRFKRVHVETR